MSDASISLLSLNHGFHYTGRIAFWVYCVISRFSLEVFLHLVAAQGLRRNCRADSIWFVHLSFAVFNLAFAIFKMAFADLFLARASFRSSRGRFYLPRRSFEIVT
jgi:hypothetical protein